MRVITRLASKIHLLDQVVSEVEVFESMKEAIKEDEKRVEIPIRIGNYDKIEV